MILQSNASRLSAWCPRFRPYSSLMANRKPPSGGHRHSQQDWYEKTRRYWSGVEPTVNGVLGGMEHVHEDDIRESKAFLESLPSVGRERALDCGAGIGRVSKYLLCPLFQTTDVMERSPQMLAEAKAALPPDSVGEFLAESIEQAVLRYTYDVIVMQWVAAYLEDDDLTSFLSRCKTALKPNGVVFIKDNISSDNHLFLNKEDFSRIRPDRHYKLIFDKSGLACIREGRQRKWPRDLCQAKMYALR
jgi:protein N-terminal methyltransferase